jgi:hypothetical protein
VWTTRTAIGAQPFVHFAYNSSRQEITSKSSCFLMHGRYTVLPIDANFGADPNQVQMVESESVGLGSYKEWMLGNLQRAFVERDGRSQTVQDHHKRYYEQKRREANLRGRPTSTSLSTHPTGGKGREAMAGRSKVKVTRDPERRKG